MRLRSLFLILGFLSCGSIYAQGGASFNDKFFDLNLLMEDQHYVKAIPGWEALYAEDSTNSNVAYKLAYCYLHSESEVEKAPSMFEVAIRNVTKSYNSFSSAETYAPIPAYYYYAKALHATYQLDSAISMYNKFREMASKKHYLQKYVGRDLEMVANAAELMSDPVSIVVKNMGDVINSTSQDYGPVISLDENTIFFTSRKLRPDSTNQYYIDPIDGMHYEDVYQSFKDEKGNWMEPELIGFSRSNQHDATISLSPDGQTLYIFRVNDDNGNIYKSELDGEIWGEPVKLPANINSKYRETHITVSSDNQALYFSSDRKGGFGGMDIYRCLRLPNGEWSLAQNVGPEINTKFDEEAPFIHPDGKTLYFSSKGHKSMGEFDIFFSEKKSSGWTQPQNIGYPINTAGSDIFYMTSADGTRAYYSSVDESGERKRDLFMIEYEDAVKKQLTLIKGFVKMPDGVTIPDDIRIVMTDNETGEFIAEAKPLVRNGSFVFIIPSGKNYNLSYESDGQEFYNENIYVPEGSEYHEVEKEIFLNPIEGPAGIGKFEVEAGEMVPKSSAKWFYRPNKAISGEVVAKYVSSGGTELGASPLDADGYFNHVVVDPNTSYSVQFFQGDEKVCAAGKVLLNAREDVEMVYDQASCSYAPKEELMMFTAKYESGDLVEEGVLVNYLDSDGKVLFEEKVDGQGVFAYHKLDIGKELILSFVKRGNAICEPLIISLNKRPDLILAGNANCEFKPSSDPHLRAKHAKTEIVEFKKNFGYNKNKVESVEFDRFIDDIVKIANASGKVLISIESSASRVPTKSYNSNLDLAKKRAQDAKALLIKKLTKKGLKEAQLVFVNMSTLVQGPAYAGDAGNTEKYGPFQYVYLKGQ